MDRAERIVPGQTECPVLSLRDIWRWEVWLPGFLGSSDWRSLQMNVQAPAESRGSCVQLLWHDSYSAWIAVLCFMLFICLSFISGSGPSHRKSQLSLNSNGAYVVWPEGTPLIVYIFNLFVWLYSCLLTEKQTGFELVIVNSRDFIGSQRSADWNSNRYKVISINRQEICLKTQLLRITQHRRA